MGYKTFSSLATPRIDLPEAEKTARAVLAASPAEYLAPIPGKLDARAARLVLGLSISDSQRQAEQKFRRLLALNHPDRGGSPYLSGLISDAMNILLASDDGV